MEDDTAAYLQLLEQIVSAAGYQVYSGTDSESFP